MFCKPFQFPAFNRFRLHVLLLQVHPSYHKYVKPMQQALKSQLWAKLLHIQNEVCHNHSTWVLDRIILSWSLLWVYYETLSRCYYDISLWSDVFWDLSVHLNEAMRVLYHYLAWMWEKNQIKYILKHAYVYMSRQNLTSVRLKDWNGITTPSKALYGIDPTC